MSVGTRLLVELKSHHMQTKRPGSGVSRPSPSKDCCDSSSIFDRIRLQLNPAVLSSTARIIRDGAERRYGQELRPGEGLVHLSKEGGESFQRPGSARPSQFEGIFDTLLNSVQLNSC